VYGAEAQPALARLGDRLEDSVDPDDVAQTVADAVRSGLSVPYAAVTVDPAATAEAGTATDESALEPFPVSYQGRRVATIAVAPRAGEAALTPRDRVVLQRLARRAGAALHGAGVVAELRAARERLVLAREEERRRIRRDLHDDLAPTLAGLGMSVAAASSFARTDPARAQSLAAELQEGIRRAAVQIREIAYDLRPPELDDHGLVATLRHRVCHTSPGDPLTVAVSAPGERLPLPAAVEIAALRIVQEAVANARRHSDATRCDVTLRTADGQLTIDVSDDGRGIAPGTTMGIGLRSIEERADELGGRSELTSGPSGTTLRVALPTQWARR
jgi:signal transduction histidine kinase